MTARQGPAGVVGPEGRQTSLDIALDLGASLNPQEVIRRLMQRTVKALRADRASLLLLEEGGGAPRSDLWTSTARGSR